ncbi:MAG: response regulator [Candidatus Riflebacteria bacterium]|nr:response regulator [Candidatus Riflebacteria bacterium]
MDEMKKILVVDDDSDFLKITEEILVGAGFLPVCVINTEDALKKISEDKFDLIILDMMMNSITEGFDFASRLKNDEKTAEIPIILVSSMTESPHFPEKFHQLFRKSWPVSASLEKPFSAKVLINRINDFIK